MLTRKNAKNGDDVSILGFGCMRLPMKGSAVDEERAIALIRDAVDKGVNYFDSAYIYHGGKSEAILGRALEGGYRERVKIATKLPLFMVRKLEAAKKIFGIQLERLRTGRIDYYLLHMCTDKAMFDRLADLGVMSWLEELKAAGAIGNIGFSFHGVKRDFAELIAAYPWDFCQIQYNYLDENNQAGRDGLLQAHALGIPVIVMEPLRGGKLVNGLPKAVSDAFAASGTAWTPAEWALRWVWNHPEVTLLLSGMSDEAQLADNVRMAADALPGGLSPAQLEAFAAAKRTLQAGTKVPCTACGYCMPCPSGVDIPACFSAYNEKYLLRHRSAGFHYLQNLGLMSARPAYASLCTECGKCVKHCPQSIAIPAELKQVAKEMEGWYFKPMVALAGGLLGIRRKQA
jgi:predicted aldo/keto reductase-like oxidoreductase